MSEGVTYGRRLTMLAGERGDEIALVFAADDGGEQALSWRTVDERANQAAALLAERGVVADDVVVVALRNSPEHVAATLGAWKLGASALPLRGDLPPWERDRLLALAHPRVAVGDWAVGDWAVGDWADGSPGTVHPDEIRAGWSVPASPPVEDHAPPCTRLLATSGSTGTPKIIVNPSPGIYVEPDPSGPGSVGEDGRVTLCASPLYHNNGFSYCFAPLLRGDQVILLGHFDAARAVDLIERHGVTMTVLVPTMLQRIARLPDVRDRDFSSLLRVVYGGASLPEWVARTWLELVPPERFHFVYGGSEVVGVATCTGREWLEHPGTTGVAVSCDIAILDGDRKPLPPGEVGEIWMRLHSEQQPFQYIGTPTPAPILGGYRTYGDMGWLDEDGYLYIADRRQDMIVTGGVNVFPAEVEAALSEHPGLVDAVVIGIPDAEWGHRVHAVVQPVDPADPPSTDDLRAFCKERLSGPKVPKDFEIVEEMPRTSAGKVNRSRLVEARSPAG